MANNKSSDQLLEQLWKSFELRMRREHQGVRISKRTVSQDLLRTPGMADAKDPHVLSRWTNPGDKDNWRIPIARIAHTVGVLGGSQDDIDALMIARLNEIERNNADDSAVCTAHWLVQYSDKLLSRDERWLLKTYREANSAFNGNLFVGAGQSLANRALLQVCLEQCVQSEVEHLQEDDGLESQLTPTDSEQRERISALVASQISQALAAASSRQADEDGLLEQQRQSALKAGSSGKSLEAKAVKKIKARLSQMGVL